MCTPRITTFILSVALFLTPGLSQDFGYDGNEGPNYWGVKYHACTGKHQSPINIDDHNVEPVNLLPIRFENFDFPPTNATLTNNGHTVLLKIDTPRKPTITGGPLIGKYEFAQLHFHWGSNDFEGSENTINNYSFPMELHIVFFSSSYGSFVEAIDHPDGIAVLSFLYAKSPEENKHYAPIIDALHLVANVSTATQVTGIPGLDDLLVRNRSVYFTYSGSLTTPPCSEVVTWIEYRSTIPLAHEQFEAFRHLNSIHGKLLHNFRPTQPLHGRAIRMNRDVDIYHVNERNSCGPIKMSTTFWINIILAVVCVLGSFIQPLSIFRLLD